MTKAAIDCSRCGAKSQVPVHSLLVDVAGPQADEAVAGTVYWICDTCHDVAGHPVQWPALLTLVAAGAPLFDEDDDDSRPTHPEAPAGGPALTRDDLLDMHTLLQQPTWFAELQAGMQASRGERAA